MLLGLVLGPTPNAEGAGLLAETDWQEYPAQRVLWVHTLPGWSLRDTGLALKLTWRIVWSLVRAGCSRKPCSQGNCGRCHHGCSSDWLLPQIPAQTWSFRSLPPKSLTRNWYMLDGVFRILCSFLRAENLLKPPGGSRTLERSQTPSPPHPYFRSLTNLGQLGSSPLITVAYFAHLPPSSHKASNSPALLFILECSFLPCNHFQ